MNNPNIRKAVHNVTRVFRAIGQAFLLPLGFDCEARRRAVDAGACDFSGEGRNRYGV